MAVAQERCDPVTRATSDSSRSRKSAALEAAAASMQAKPMQVALL